MIGWINIIKSNFERIILQINKQTKYPSKPPRRLPNGNSVEASA